MKRTPKKIWALFTTIVLGVACIISHRIIEQGAGSEFNQTIGLLGLFAFLWCGFTICVRTGTMFSLVFMFEFAFYILTLGQSFLYGLGIDLDSTLDLYLQNPASQVNRAYLFSICCLLALHIGILLYSPQRRRKKRNDASVDYTRSMKTVAHIGLPIAFIAYAYQMVSLFSVYSASGYSDAYESISGTSLFIKLVNIIAKFFPFLLFLLLAAYRDNKRKRLPIIITLLFISFLNFAIGNRSEPICYIMAVLWFYRRYAENKAEKRRAARWLMITALLLLIIVPIIGEARNTGELSLATVLNSFSGTESAIEQIKKTIISMGWSAFPTIKTMYLIPSLYNYHYGQSYFFALLAIIPNIFGGTHIAVKYAGLPQWLKKALHMSFGPGFSMPAEAYYNFGWMGIAAMPFLGLLIAKILDESAEKESAMRLYVMMAGFVILFSIPRREMLTAVRTFSYYIGIVYLAVRFIHRCTTPRHSREQQYFTEF